MNETLGAKLDKLGKDFNRLMTSDFIQNFAKNMTDALISIVKWLKDLPDLYNKYRVSISAIMTVITAYVAQQKISNLLSKEGIGLRIYEAILLRAAIIYEQVLLAWRSKSTTVTKLAAAAQALFNSTLALNPIGWVILAIGALITAYKLYDKYNATSVELEERKISTLYKSKNLIDKTKDGYQKLSDQVQRFITLSKNERDSIVETTKARLSDLKAQMTGQMIKRQILYRDVYNQIYDRNTMGTGFVSPEKAEKVKEKAREKATRKALEAVKDIDDANLELQEGIKSIEAEYDKLISIVNSEQLGDTMGTDNSSMLQKKLEYYKQALSILTQGTSDYMRVVGKIQQTQKLLDQYNIDFGGETNEKTAKEKVNALEKYLKYVEDTYEKVLERIKEHNRDVEQLHMEAAEKEIDLIRQKYEKDLLPIQQTLATLMFNPANAAEMKRWQLAYNDLVDAMNKEIAAKTTEQAEELEKKKADIRKKYGLLTIEEEKTQELAELQKLYDGGLLKYEEYMKKKEDIRRKYEGEQKRSDIDKKYGNLDKYGLLTDDQLQEKEIAELEASAMTDGTLSVENIEAAKEKIREKYRKLREDRDQEATRQRLESAYNEIESAKLMIQTLSDFFTSMKDYELAKAGENEEKKKQIMKKYADIEMAITISNIIANTAGAIMKAAEQLGVMALPFQLFLGATGAVQVGMAMAQRNKVQSLETGGYTGSGIGMSDSEGKQIAGVVHPDEYVIPAWERKIPMVANFERIIEAIRTNRGFEAGGQTTREIIKSEPVYMANPELLYSINKLNDLLSQGIETRLIANEQYLKVHNKAQQKLTDIKNQSTR